jgi:phosphopantothenoylcysteine decarboxylase / phosphopantothenate---cysteine ligase
LEKPNGGVIPALGFPDIYPMVLQGRNIILGITGSIAAYKSAFLVRELIKAGANVKVIMTDAAKQFITPLTISTLSKNPVISDLFDEEGTWHNHVEYGLWADLIIIAPATANTIAAMASGVCDNMLLATYLSAKCPVYFAPAMDLDMWAHPSTKDNLNVLLNRKNIIIHPGEGELASGLTGEGRMAEPVEIVEFIQDHLNKNLPLAGKQFLITAGPTFEAIDPVRFIGNHSSGKMGFAIAREAAKQGAIVKLVAGPVSLADVKGVERFNVTSALEMNEVCLKHFNNTDVAILSAAVADYRPKTIAENKIKKNNQALVIDLEPTEDILAGLGKLKSAKQLLIGFALETDNEVENAIIKLKKKNLDMIVLNSLNDKGAGFKVDTNKVTLIRKDNKTVENGLKSKEDIAKDIIAETILLLKDA